MNHCYYYHSLASWPGAGDKLSYLVTNKGRIIWRRRHCHIHNKIKWLTFPFLIRSCIQWYKNSTRVIGLEKYKNSYLDAIFVSLTSPSNDSGTKLASVNKWRICFMLRGSFIHTRKCSFEQRIFKVGIIWCDFPWPSRSVILVTFLAGRWSHLKKARSIVLPLQ